MALCHVNSASVDSNQQDRSIEIRKQNKKSNCTKKNRYSRRYIVHADKERLIFLNGRPEGQILMKADSAVDGKPTGKCIVPAKIIFL